MITWYPLLKNSGGLLHAQPDAFKKLVICYNDGRRSFACFEDHIEFTTFFLQSSKHHFFEVIEGSRKQKPHFDIDFRQDQGINPSELLTEIVQALEELIPGLKPDSQVMVFDSSDSLKGSFHVVVTGWYHNSSVESKKLYHEVIKRVRPDWRKAVDEAVYSSCQQFRIFGSSKAGTTRVKKLVKTWNYRGVPIHYHHPVSVPVNTPKMELRIILENSLITNTAGCMYVPGCKAPEPVLEEKQTLTEEEGSQVIALVKAHDPAVVFEEVRNNVYCFRRLRPSSCAACSRIHEAENPYAFAVYGLVYFNCRRNRRSTLLGALFAEAAPPEDLTSLASESMVVSQVSEQSAELYLGVPDVWEGVAGDEDGWSDVSSKHSDTVETGFAGSPED